MNKLFENAKFGDTFQTSDGRIAIFQYKDSTTAHLFTEENEICVYLIDGCVDSRFFSEKDDIISQWGKIDEDILDKMAFEKYPSDYSSSLYYDPENDINIDLRDAFKEGYRRAKKENF